MHFLTRQKNTHNEGEFHPHIYVCVFFCSVLDPLIIIIPKFLVPAPDPSHWKGNVREPLKLLRFGARAQSVPTIPSAHCLQAAG